jgi:transcriptional regulator GlxA family with amidase domain
VQLARIAVLTQKLPEPAAAQRRFRALFVASGDGVPEAALDSRLVGWLRNASAAVDTVCAIGDGSAILHAAQARLSDTVRSAPPVPAVQTALASRLSFHGPACRSPYRSRWTATNRFRQKILDSAQWIARNCDQRISITTAAQQPGMSERSYLRHFRAEMGINPSEHLRRTRVELASVR